MWAVKMTIFDDKAQIWSRDTSFWSKLIVDYEIKGLARKGYSWDHLATKIYFSKIFQNDVIETGSHQTPLILQGTTSVVYHEVIQTKNKIVRVSLRMKYDIRLCHAIEALRSKSGQQYNFLINYLFDHILTLHWAYTIVKHFDFSNKLIKIILLEPKVYDR